MHGVIPLFFIFDDIIFSYIAIAAATTAAVGTGVAAYGQLKGVEAQKKAEKARAHQAELEAARQRLTQVREARAKAAAIAQSSESQGSGLSSSAQSGAAGVTGQLNSNQQYITQQQLVGEQLSRANNQISDAQGISVLGKGITDIGGTVFAHKDTVTDIFKNG